MSLLKALGLLGRREPEPEVVTERRSEERRPMFQEADLVLGDFERMRVVVTNLSSRGVRVEFSSRADLPFRVQLIAPSLKLNCWARVVWQDAGAAGLELQEPT